MLLTEQEISLLAHNIDDGDWNDLNYQKCWHEGFVAGARAIESAVLEKLKAQEPDAWRTFDGEGGYDYRSYVDNEEYQAEFLARNPSSTYKNWVEPLYEHPLPPDDVVRDPRVAELEAVLRECREALVPYMKYVDGTKVLNYPAQCVAKIDEVLPE